MMHYVGDGACGKALQIGVFRGCDHPQQERHRILSAKRLLLISCCRTDFSRYKLSVQMHIATVGLKHTGLAVRKT